MTDRTEGAVRNAAAPLGRWIRRDESRVAFFERLELAQERVILRIGDLRLGEHVIPILVMPDLLAQLPDLPADRLQIDCGSLRHTRQRPTPRRSASKPGRPACRIFA